MSLRHTPDVSAKMCAQERQEHTEKPGTEVAVCGQNQLDGGKDASKAGDKKVQDGDLG